MGCRNRTVMFVGGDDASARCARAFPPSADERMPKGDHNRRLSLGLDIDQFAVEAGITAEQLYKYEMTPAMRSLT